MLCFEVEMVMMQMIMEMMIYHMLDVISMQMMLILHVVQHVVAMVIQVNAVTLRWGKIFDKHLLPHVDV